MMPAPFHIQHDGSRYLLRATLHGHWTVDQVVAFGRAIRTGLSDAIRRDPAAKPALLIDASHHGVQSQEVVAQLQALSSSIGTDVSCIGVVVASALHKLQAHRINPGSLHRVFGSEEDALAWIVERATAARRA